MKERCNHSRGNIQQFTEMCLDCMHNIYESDEEYDKIEVHRDSYRKQNKAVEAPTKEELQRTLDSMDEDIFKL